MTPFRDLALRIDGDATIFRPGDTVRGEASLESRDFWDARYADIVVYWRTEGTGDTDKGLAGKVALLPAGQRVNPGREVRRFEFRLPDLPWTYHGRVLKIHWVLGVYVRPKTGDEVFKEIELTVHPRPEAIQDTPPTEV